MTRYFVPWLRRGVSTLAAPDPGKPTSGRLVVSTKVTIGGSDLNVNAVLQGPMDVVGFDPGAVLRTWPQADDHNATHEHFAMIEFAQADLPWRLTPTGKESSRPLPWLVLIVLKDGEWAPAATPDNGIQCDHIQVSQPASLPDLTNSWAWAHAEVLGTGGDAASVKSAFQSSPERLVSRLICPRPLSKDASYTAFLVPSFRSGLRIAHDAPASTDPAWPAKPTASVTLPVYHQWSFKTGGAPTFAELIRNLTLFKPVPGAGKRELDLTALRQQLLGGPPVKSVASLPGMLRFATDPESEPSFEQALAKPLLDKLDQGSSRLKTRPDAAKRQVVSPPVYGCWHAAVDTVSSTKAPPWLKTLNQNPCYRAAAGVAAGIIQKEHRNLMVAAWEQVDGVKKANELIRRSHVSRHVSRNIHKQRVRAGDGSALQFTSPLHARVRSGQGNISSGLASLGIAGAAADPQWRRMTRPLGPIGLLQNRLGARGATGVLADLGNGSLSPQFGVRTERKMAVLPDHDASQDKDQLATRLFTAARPPQAFTVNFAAAPKAAVLRDPSSAATSLATLGGDLSKGLDPETTIGKRLRKLVGTQGDGAATGAGNGGEVLAAPHFDVPMYEHLAAISQDWILPGLNKVGSETVSLLAVNQKMIEAFMVGANHAMARELAWNNYPTDRRGTCFRYFWAITATNKDSGDIADIAQWDKLKPSALGAHCPYAPNAGQGDVVLLVRSKLFSVYRDALIYALPATKNAAGAYVMDETKTPKLPIFGGSLDSDLRFFGFDIPSGDALSDGTSGWFFVIQEHPTGVRFGLDNLPDVATSTFTDLGAGVGDAGAAAAKYLHKLHRFAIHGSSFAKDKSKK
ncbi:MAG: hypothetical protein HY075_01670 [Deltaproteobacteria bacterium]|nr:hypothetical protein [Deltaproteobacteria bacterium]